VSKALPIFLAPHFWPRTTSARVATYHFCARVMISVIILKFEAFRLSLLAFVSQVPFYIRLVLEINRWPGACRLSFERVLDAIISRSSERIVTQR
jgi:hypothetical protein